MPVDDDARVTITLEAHQWNVILGALHDVPYRVALPIIQELTKQFLAATEPPARTDGEIELRVE